MSDDLFPNICYHCGQAIEEGKGKTIPGHGEVCQDCVDKYTQCYNCDDWFKLDDLTTLNDDILICSNCIDDYEKCCECNKYFHVDEGEEIGSNFYCDDCREDFFVCEECGEVIHNDDSFSAYKNNNEVMICEDCYDKDYTTCEICDKSFHDDDISYYSSLNCSVCNSCAEDHVYFCEHCNESYWSDDGPQCDCNSHSENLHDANYKPDVIFNSIEKGKPVNSVHNSPDKLYLGFELEIEFSSGDGLDDFITYSNDNYDEDVFWNKEDGSLSSSGCEVVSQPMTLDYHKKFAPWTTIIKEIHKIGANSHNGGGCGLHVHINRSYLSKQIDVVKLLYFSDLFQEQLEKLGRRKFNTYCHSFKDCVDWSGSLPTWKTYLYYTGCGPERYCAVNTTNRRTIEFRFPRGTLKESSFFATLELIDAIVKYCKYISISKLTKSNWNDFVSFVTNQKEYKTLVNYMKEREAYVSNNS